MSASDKTPPLPPEIARRAAAGEAAAFEALVRHCERAAWGIALKMCRDRHLAADVVQEVFLQIFRKLDSWDPRRPFMPWFFRVATNTTINTLKLRRNRRRRVLSELGEADEGSGGEALAVDEGPDGAARVEEAERRRTLRRVIAALPEKYSAIVTLRYLEDLSIDEIAEALEMPTGTVKVRLFRARDLLRRRLGELGLGD